MNLANDELEYWQLVSELEEGRNQVLRMAAKHEELNVIFDTLCAKARRYSPDMFCSILRLNNETKTLHSLAVSSLPKEYCEAIEGLSIGSGVGSCGTSAYTKERVIVEDINTHPYWAQYKHIALDNGLQACWSEPIVGADGVVFGTFAMYYKTPKTPTVDDISFIEASSNLAAVVFESYSNREKLLNANNLLNRRINERNAELERVNLALAKAIEEQQKQFYSNLRTEKMLTANSLIAGFSHEISTPVGTALTATSIAEEKLDALLEKMSQDNLSRSFLMNILTELLDINKLNRGNLLKVNGLLNRFKDINTFSNVELKTEFLFNELLDDIEQAMEKKLDGHQLSVQCEGFNTTANKEAIWQIFYNLIENSIEHGFSSLEKGIIHINVVTKNDEIVINYQDNGSGIKEDKTAKIFEPFYTSSRNKKHLGLGLSITNNLINHNLQGRIRVIDVPKGMRFEITLPIRCNKLDG